MPETVQRAPSIQSDPAFARFRYRTRVRARAHVGRRLAAALAVLACLLTLAALAPASVRAGDAGGMVLEGPGVLHEKELGGLQPIGMAGLKELLDHAKPDVWMVGMAAWCGPCRAELPDMVETWLRYHNQGLRIWGVSLDARPDGMTGILSSQPVPFPVYWVGEAGITELDLKGIPAILFVREGKIVGRHVGRASQEQLDALAREWLGIQ